MFKGYLQLGGTEIINAARTMDYVRKQAPHLPLRDIVDVGDLQLALGDDEYNSPMTDDAPWHDASDPATQGFYGLYPLEIQGHANSTRSAQVTQAIVKGGTVGQIRHGTREMRVRGLLIARNAMSAEAGFTWLRNALDPSPCGDHGGTCTGATMCYYAAAPVADPNIPDWSKPISEVVDFGELSADTSPLIYRFTRPGPAAMKWNFKPSDSLVVQWGAMELGSQTEIWTSEETIIQRTNYVTDPSFEKAQSWWTVDSKGRFTRMSTGGADGGGFARLERLTPDRPTTVRTNWVANPGASVDPTLAGWLSNAEVFERLPDPTAPFGDYVVSALASSGYGYGGYGEGEYGVGGVPSTPLSIRIPIIGPSTTLTLGVASVWLRATPDAQTISLIGQDGAVVAQSPIPPLTAPWTRVNITGMIGLGVSIEIATVGVASRDIAVGGVLVEEGTEPRAYFDGDFPNSQTVRYTWASSPGLSESMELIGDFTEYSFTSGPTGSLSGETIMSLALRSQTGPEITLQMLSATDMSVLGETIVKPGRNWSRYSLAIPHGRDVVIRVIGYTSFDVDQVLLERGVREMPYFDGSTPMAGWYDTTWVGGAANAARSRMVWSGIAGYDRSQDDWRPFLRVVYGKMSSVSISMTHYEMVPIEQCVEPFERQFHDVTCIDGPNEIQRIELQSGAVFIEVDFTLVAGSPFPYGTPRTLLSKPMSDLVFAPYVDVPEAEEELSVILDPDCPPLPQPPRPPMIVQDCVDEGPPAGGWRRHWLDIPGEEVAAWSATVPTIKLSTLHDDVRQVRVRFFPNPFGYPAQQIDPTSYCSEFILSYLPANAVLTMDGTVERAVAAVAGRGAVPVNNLLYGTGGGPMSWPELSCGIPYVMTIDMPQTSINDVSLELALTRRE